MSAMRHCAALMISASLHLILKVQMNRIQCNWCSCHTLLL